MVKALFGVLFPFNEIFFENILKNVCKFQKYVYLCKVINNEKQVIMKTIEFKTAAGEVKTAIISTRIDENLFSCKSSSSKRKDDLFIHISMILSDVTDVKIDDCEYSSEESYSNTDEFEGLCQANQIGENPFKSTMLVNR